MNDEHQPLGLPQNGQTLMLPLPPDRFSTAVDLHGQIHRYATALRKRWWILLLSLVAVGGPAVFLAVIQPPVFQSQALLWLSSRPNLPGQGSHTEELTSYIGTQAELIKSPSVQFRAFERMRVRYPMIAGGGTNSRPADLPFDLSVRSSMKNSVLELRAKGPSPEATQAFLDAVIDEYLAVKKESRKRISSGDLSRITDQIHEVEKQIQQQQDHMTRFLTSNNISYLTEHGLSAGGHLAKLDEVLSELRTEHRLLELLTPAEFKDLSEGPQVIFSDTALPGEKVARALAINTAAPQSAYYQALQQIQVLRAKRDEFAQVIRPTHSKMVKLNQEIAGLEQLLKTLQSEGEQRCLAQMENRKKSLELQIQNLESQYRGWETNATEASHKLTEYDRMKQDLQRSQALYDRLLGLLQTVDLNNNLDREPLAPLAPASLARPTLAKYGTAAAGLFLAVLVGVGIFFLLELLDDRFNSVRELCLHLPAEVLGQIPRTRLRPPKGIRHLLPTADTQPAFAESFRYLCSSLLFMSEQNSKPKVILVTSAIPKEGKTTVASNLAATLALSGSRVLLVDADFRCGSVHRIFQVGHKPGLLEVLSQAVSSAQAIVPTADPNLFILPAGEAGGSTSVVFVRCRVDLLLQDLAGQYSYIIIDSAPVLATDDAACLGPHADGAFMVVRASYTSARMTREALHRLRRCNVKILGLVYNYASPSTDYYSRYGRDYYSTTVSTNLRAPATAANATQDGQTANQSREAMNSAHT